MITCNGFTDELGLPRLRSRAANRGPLGLALLSLLLTLLVPAGAGAQVPVASIDVFIPLAGPDSVLCTNDGTGSLTCAAVPGTQFGSLLESGGADFDNDGDIDVIVGQAGGSAQLCLNDGNGGFSCSSMVANMGTSGGLITLGDIDNDGNTDVFLAWLNRDVRACINQISSPGGPVSFSCSNLGTLGRGTNLRVAHADLGDLDGDGDLDVVFATNRHDLGNRYLRCLNTDPAGKFATFTPTDCAVIGARAPTFGGHNGALDVELADWDGDGDLDALFLERGVADTQLCLNDGNGNFPNIPCGRTTQRPPPGSQGQIARAADYDGDGDLDYLHWETQPRFHTLFTPTGGVFTGALLDAAPLNPNTPNPNTGSSEWADWADMDGDGDLDIVGGSRFGGGGFEICENDRSAGTFECTRFRDNELGWFRGGLVLADFVSGAPDPPEPGTNSAPFADAGGPYGAQCTAFDGTNWIAELMLNGTASTDPDGDALLFEWTGPFGTTAASSSPTATVLVPEGTHAVTLVVTDDGTPPLSDDDATTATVDCSDCGARIDVAIAEVEALGLNGGKTNALVSKLENAKKSAGKGKVSAAVNQIGAFKNQVEAFRGKGLANAEADFLIAMANSIIACLLG